MTIDRASFGKTFRSLLPEQQKEYIDTLSPEQQYAISQMWEIRARENQLPPEGDWRYWLILAGRGYGKLLDIECNIPTPSGWKKMGDLELGDEVFDENGNPCHVIWRSDIQIPERVYRLTFSDGSSIDACSDHEWVTWDRTARRSYLRSPYENTNVFPDDWVNWKLKRIHGRSLKQETVEQAIELHQSGLSIREIEKTLGVSRQSLAPHMAAGKYLPREPKIYPDSPSPKIRTTQEIVDTLRYGKRGDLNHCIPQCRPLQLPDAELPIPPYLLGLWLSDGCKDGATISKHQDDLPFLRAQIEAEGFATSDRADIQQFGVLGLVPLLRQEGLLGNKHVPPLYLRASFEQRLAFLQGLLDGDGYVGENNYCEFSNTNPSIANGVYELLVGMGIRVTRAKKIPTLNGVACAETEILKFVPTLDVFRLPRKKDRLRYDRGQSLRRYHRMIVNAEQIEPMPMRCIMVDSPNHMYLAGESMIPTHNRAIVQWAHAQAMSMPGSIGVMVATTAADVRDVLLEGESGILTTVPDYERPHYSPTKASLTWSNGARALLRSADKPDGLRGLNSYWAICDELAAWRRPDSINQILLGLRLGEHPRMAIATTPKPVKHLREFMKRKHIALVTGSSYENRANLSEDWFNEIIVPYEGTRIGKQEIEGVLLDDLNGALWTSRTIEDNRFIPDDIHAFAETLERIVVGVDPAVTSKTTSNKTGIIVAGKDRRGHAYVLDDRTIKASPDGWAREAVNAYHEWKADRIVAEVNNGGDLVEHTVRTVDENVPFTAVRASRGKISRAEPVVALYEQGRVHHCAVFALLETQQLEWSVGDESPDEIDSLTWAITELLLGSHEEPAIMRQGRANFASRRR